MNHELIKKLDTFASYLKQFRQQLRLLVEDIKFSNAGGCLVYAVDFSEVYFFIDPTAKLPEDIIIGLLENPESATQQYRLGLTHLFFKSNDCIYFLPPHVHEMWSYIRHRSNEAEPPFDILQHVRDAISKLDADDRQLLKSLAQQHQVATPKELEQLIDLGKNKYTLFFQVAVLALTVATDKISRLSDLIKKDRLSYRIEENIFKPRNISLTSEEFSPEEINKIFNYFSDASRQKYPLQKRLDARALLFLEKSNQLLNEYRVKIILITRDQAVISAAEELKKTGNSCVYSYLRGIDTVLFDLMLHGTPDENELDEINKVDKFLAKLEQSAEDLSKKINLNTELAKLDGRQINLIEQSLNSWNEYVNLRLAWMIPRLPWLRQTIDAVADQKLLEEAVDKEAIDLLSIFWQAVKKPEYQDEVKRCFDKLLKRLIEI